MKKHHHHQHHLPLNVKMKETEYFIWYKEDLFSSHRHYRHGLQNCRGIPTFLRLKNVFRCFLSYLITFVLSLHFMLSSGPSFYIVFRFCRDSNPRPRTTSPRRSLPNQRALLVLQILQKKRLKTLEGLVFSFSFSSQVPFSYIYM